MIKFVCVNCGERLSVPDAHGGKKGACPTCQAVNRVPLKGYAETQPKFPVVARPVPKSQAGEPGARSQEPVAASPVAMPHDSVLSPQSSVLAPFPSIPSPQSSVLPSSSAAARFTSPDKVVTPPDNDAALRTMRRSRQESTRPAGMTPTMTTRPRKELRLPKPAKIALLILTALAFVGALYLALYLALRFAVPMN